MSVLSKIYQFFSAVNIEQQNHLQEVVVNTWVLNGKDVRLIRSGDKLEYELSYHHGVTKRCVIDFPQDKSIEQAIAHLRTLDVYVDDQDIVHFVRKMNINQKNKYTSFLDNYSIIDNDHGAVTLADVGSCKLDPKTWGGHAALYIEIIENNNYLLRRAHLRKDGQNQGFVTIKDVKNFNSRMITSKSVTWIRSKNLIQQMICDIEQEKLAQENGSSPIQMDLRGQGALGVEEIAHNCFTWAKQKLKIAKVYLWEESHLVSPMVIRPKTYIALDSLNSKERILAQIEGSNLTLDITQEIDKLAGGCPWKLSDKDNEEPSIISTKGSVDKLSFWFGVHVEASSSVRLITDGGKVLNINPEKAIVKVLKDEGYKLMSTSEKILSIFLNHPLLKAIDRALYGNTITYYSPSSYNCDNDYSGYVASSMVMHMSMR